MRNRPFLSVWVGLWLFLLPSLVAEESRRSPDLFRDNEELRTLYQQAGGYNPRFDLQTDGVMIYGTSDGDIAGFEKWKASGSILQTMTGVAWGGYGDFLDGAFDGSKHWDDAQVRSDGETVWHSPGIPYLNPSIPFCDYLTERLKKVIDAGVTTITLEEPEFWAFSGWGDGFKNEWRLFYGQDWIAPDSSPDAQFRASFLKVWLYRRAMGRIGAALKDYSLRTYGRPLTFYVATHSLLSYAQIQMVSPEAEVIDLPEVDGLIAQVWTGTARNPNYYRGELKERTFETAFLEYGVMAEMTRGTGKRTYLLNDPVEDDPKHDWTDYRVNYRKTLTASLMAPEATYFEVAPWPSRVFLGKFPAGSPDAQTIPADYASILLAGFHQLRDMDQPDGDWSGATDRIGILLSDSAMFQRGASGLWESGASDPPEKDNESAHERNRMSGFFGLALPLLKGGIPVGVPVLDHLTKFPGYLDRYRVLILSYEFQKPLVPGIHSELVEWVRRGGTLVYVGTGADPFHSASLWWNRGEEAGRSDERLLDSFGIPRDAESGSYPVGKGLVILDRTDPAYYSRSLEGAEEFRQRISDAAESAGLGKLPFRNYLVKERGPYLLAACLDESVSEQPLVLEGNFIDLFDAGLPILHRVSLAPGMEKWLLNLDQVRGDAPMPLVCGGRISEWTETGDGVRFQTSSPVGVELIARLLLKKKPEKVIVQGEPLENWGWDESSRTLYLTYPVETAEPVEVEIR